MKNDHAALNLQSPMYHFFFNTHNIKINSDAVNFFYSMKYSYIKRVLIIDNGVANITCAFILPAHHFKLPVAFLVIVPFASGQVFGRQIGILRHCYYVSAPAIGRASACEFSMSHWEYHTKIKTYVVVLVA